MSIIDRERNELIAQLREDENCPEKCFIEQAIAQLEDREKIVLQNIEKYANYQNTNSQNCCINDVGIPKTECVNVNEEITRPKVLASNKIDENCYPSSNSSENVNRSRFESVSSEGLGSEDFNTNVTVEDLDTASNATSVNDNNTDNNVKQYYFYQGKNISIIINLQRVEYTYNSS